MEGQFKDLEDIVHGRCVESPKDLVERHIGQIERHYKAKEELCKLLGECMRCDAAIPIGGRPIRYSAHGEKNTSALCETCSKAVVEMVKTKMAERRARLDAANPTETPDSQ